MAERRLQVFRAVVKHGSFTRAAEALFMSQPSVTFQIRQLEEEYRVRLLDRNTGSVTPTPDATAAPGSTATPEASASASPSPNKRPLPELPTPEPSPRPTAPSGETKTLDELLAWTPSERDTADFQNFECGDAFPDVVDQPLIACALVQIETFAFINTLGDIGRLFVDGGQDCA